MLEERLDDFGEIKVISFWGVDEDDDSTIDSRFCFFSTSNHVKCFLGFLVS